MLSARAIDVLPSQPMAEPLLPSVELNPQFSPVASVIWMHGLGADGHDFSSVPPQLGLPADLAVRYVFPHAPSISVTLNQGMVMPAWYDVKSLDTRGEDEPGIRRSAERIQQLILREVELGIAYDRIVLAGFSQGGAMALFTGLRYPEKLAGIMVLSGYLVLPNAMEMDASEANRDIPIFQAHGRYDPLLPLGLGRQSRETLQRAGYNVEWREYPMEHQVCLEELRDIGRWLNLVLTDKK